LFKTGVLNKLLSSVKKANVFKIYVFFTRTPQITFTLPILRVNI